MSTTPSPEDLRSRIRSLLNRIGRTPSSPYLSSSTSSSPCRLPPDEAGEALGRALADDFLTYLLVLFSPRWSGGDSGDEVGSRAKSRADLAASDSGSSILDGMLGCSNPATARAFFYEVATSEDATVGAGQVSDALGRLWKSWVLRAVDGIRPPWVTSTVIASFSLRSARLCATREDATGISAAEVYRRLPSPTERRCLLRECALAAFDRSNETEPQNHGIDESFGASVVMRFLSPLLAACTLNHQSPPGERSLLVNTVVRECSYRGRTVEVQQDMWLNRSLRILPWLTRCLSVLLSREAMLGAAALTAGRTRDARGTTKYDSGDGNKGLGHDLAYDFLVSLSDLASEIALEAAAAKPAVATKVGMALSCFLDSALGHLLPPLADPPFGLCRYSLIPILDPILSIFTRISGVGTINLLVSDTALFRVAVLSLTNPDVREVEFLLRILTAASRAHQGDGGCLDLIGGSLYTAGCVHAAAEERAAAAGRLLLSLENSKETGVDASGGNGPRHMIELLQVLGKNENKVTNDLSVVVRAISQEEDGPPQSANFQCAALLIGGALLRTLSLRNDATRTYLKNLLGRYPHIGIRLMPIFNMLIKTALSCGPSLDAARNIREILIFMCQYMANDANCAQEIWALLTKITSSGGYVPIQTMVIQLYPILCGSNRRLYNRVRDSLGSVVGHPNTEVRLVAAATVCDLARLDLIRDVSDVVPWLQSHLADECSFVVYHAVMSLHHLIRSGELDFDAVVKVLNRRLRRIDDLPRLLELDGLVLEGLATLLGDGECDVGASSEEESNEEGGGAASISSQVRTAVRALLELSDALELSSSGIGTVADPLEVGRRFSSSQRHQILASIYASLSEYSLEALGVEADALRSIAANASDVKTGSRVDVEDVKRYEVIQKTAANCILLSSKSDHSINQEVGNNLGARALLLPSKLLKFEQETLGSGLLGGGGSGMETRQSRPEASRPTKVSKAALSALPDLVLTQRLYDDDPNAHTATAALLCFAAVPTSQDEAADLYEMMDRLETIASDHATDDVTDPILKAVCVQGWVQAMGKIWSTAVQLDGNMLKTSVVEPVWEWQATLENSDNAYLAMAAFALCLPDRNHEDPQGNITELSHIVDYIYGIVLSAFEGHLFESDDMAHICLGILAVRSMQSHNLDRVDTVIDLLNTTLSDETRQKTFGAVYSLGLIAQVLPTMKLPGARGGAFYPVRVQRIMATLLSELHNCLAEPCPPLLRLIAFVESGSSAADVLPTIESIKKSSLRLHEAAQDRFRRLCVGLAMGISSLDGMQQNYLLAVISLLDAIPFGTGKGLVMAAVCKTCLSSGVLSQDYVDDATAKWVELLDADLKGTRNGALRLDDILWAFTGVDDRPHAVRKKLRTSPVMARLEQILLLDGLRASSYVALVAKIGYIPSLPASILHPFGFPVELQPAATKETVTPLAEFLFQHSNDLNNSFRRNAASVALGLLSAMKYTPKNLSFFSSSDQSHRVNGPSQIRGACVDLKNLPKAREGTLLRKIVDIFEEIYVQESGIAKQMESKKTVSNIFSALSSVSIPGQFAGVIEWALNEAGNKGDDLKVSCLNLLFSQIQARRRNGSDGREYMQLFVRLYKLPCSSFVSLLGDKIGPAAFMKNFAQVLPVFPSGSAKEMLESLWRLALEVESSVTFFLSSLQKVIFSNTESQKRGKAGECHASPATMRDVCNLITDTCFPDLCSKLSGINSQWYTRNHLIWRSYFDCLRALPLSFLEEKDFFSIDKYECSVNLVRINALVYLTSQAYFNGSGKNSGKMQRAFEWLARQKLSLTDEGTPLPESDALRLAAFEAATVAIELNTKLQTDLIFHLLEVMLVEGDQSISLELMGFLAGRWSEMLKSKANDPCYLGFEGFDATSALPTLFSAKGFEDGDKEQKFSSSTMKLVSGLFRKDLPMNLALICADSGISGAVANRFSRILHSCGEVETYDILRQIVMCCLDMDTNEAEAISFLSDYISDSVSEIICNSSHKFKKMQ